MPTRTLRSRHAASLTSRKASSVGRAASVPAATELLNGVPCMRVAEVTSHRGPNIPRDCTCSSRNGFRFCGIWLLKPTSSSGSRMKPNSWVLQSKRSVAKRLRVTASPVAAAVNRSTRSREATASSELRAEARKPSREAVTSGLIGRAVPPEAQLPGGSGPGQRRPGRYPGCPGSGRPARQLMAHGKGHRWLVVRVADRRYVRPTCGTAKKHSVQADCFAEASHRPSQSHPEKRHAFMSLRLRPR